MVVYDIVLGSTMYNLIMLLIAIMFLFIAIKFPLFYFLAWFISWYGGFLTLGSTTESMLIITYFLFGIFALISFGLEMMNDKQISKRRQ